MLRRHDGKLYRELAIDASAQEDLREGDRRHAITEILFFASVGDVKRMHGLCLVHDISVSATCQAHESKSCKICCTSSRGLHQTFDLCPQRPFSISMLEGE